MAKTSQINAAVLASVLAIAAGWATWLLFWPYGLAIYVPLLAWASSKGPKPAKACVALTPFLVIPLVWLGLGIHAFHQGSAVLMVQGVPTVESTNLEPRHRVPVMHAPLTTDVRHSFGWLAYEGGVRLAGSVLGPMRGAYRGAYPDRAEAWRYLDAAKDAFADGTVIKIGTGWATLPTVDLTHTAQLRAHRVGETLLVGHPDQLWLIEERTGVIFATWRRGLNASPRFAWPNMPAAPMPVPAVAERRPRPYASPAY